MWIQVRQKNKGHFFLQYDTFKEMSKTKCGLPYDHHGLSTLQKYDGPNGSLFHFNDNSEFRNN